MRIVDRVLAWKMIKEERKNAIQSVASQPSAPLRRGRFEKMRLGRGWERVTSGQECMWMWTIGGPVTNEEAARARKACKPAAGKGGAAPPHAPPLPPSTSSLFNHP